jgi:hypothetical protein
MLAASFCRIVLVVAAVVTIVACDREPAASETASLGRLAGVQEAATRCSSSADVKADLAKINAETPDLGDRIEFTSGVPRDQWAALRDTALRTMSAVPADIREMFVRTRGVVRISDTATATCGRIVAATPATRQIGAVGKGTSSCLLVRGREKEAVTGVILLVQADTASIEERLVSGFGYYLSQYVATLALRSVGKASVVVAADDPADDFAALQGDLGAAFLRDVAGARAQPDPLSLLEPVLGEGSAGAIRGNVGAGRSPYEGLDLPKERRELYESYVVGEAFDSWNCNAWSADAGSATRERMHQMFPQAFASYEALQAKALTEVARALALLRIEAPGASRLALQDEAVGMAPGIAAPEAPVDDGGLSADVAEPQFAYAQVPGDPGTGAAVDAAVGGSAANDQALFGGADAIDRSTVAGPATTSDDGTLQVYLVGDYDTNKINYADLASAFPGAGNIDVHSGLPPTDPQSGGAGSAPPPANGGAGNVPPPATGGVGSAPGGAPGSAPGGAVINPGNDFLLGLGLGLGGLVGNLLVTAATP